MTGTSRKINQQLDNVPKIRNDQALIILQISHSLVLKSEFDVHAGVN